MNTKDSKYNGWTNYETWLANLWWDQAFTDDAQECSTVEELAERIKESVEECVADNPDNTSGFVADILNSALIRVNWREIAEHYEEDLQEPESESVTCDQCAAIMINNVFCHETGCPNAKVRERFEEEEQCPD